MKIIALYGVLQEELNINFLKVSISSLYNAVDEIIVLFDTPNNKKKIKSKFFNKKKISLYFSKRKKKKTNAPVQELLKLGRKHKGTHFLFLDADEALTYNLSKNLKKYLIKMKKGDKYFFYWLSMWKKFNYYRSDKKSIWSNMQKDFAYCDNLKDKFQEYYHDYGRTPGNSNKKNSIYLPLRYGSIMHFQFINWKHYQFKQIWNMCHTLTLNRKRIYSNIKMSSEKINRMYFYTYFENFPNIKKLKNSEFKMIPKSLLKKIKIDNSKYWQDKFILFFKENNIEKFEQLNVWHNYFMKNLFYKEKGRFPKKKLIISLNFLLFLILELVRNIFKYAIK